MRIAVYAICRDEAAFAERFAKAAADADCIVVADTGSTDGCQALLRAHGVTVHDISITPWRFDDARNAAMALVPADVDVCLSLDLDEILAPGWRAAIEAGWTSGTTRARYRFVASHTADGGDGISFMNTRLHARHGYRWRHACHERLYPDRIAESYVVLPGLRVDHWPDQSKSRAGYLDLTTAAVAEEPTSARMAHYHARELMLHARHEEAVAEFGRYLTLGDPADAGERAASHLYIARSLEILGRLDEARRHFRLATAVAPAMRETWIGLATRLYKDSDWTECLDAAQTALALTEYFPGYMSDPDAWNHTGEDLAAVACWNLGLAQQALGHAERALALCPADERLRNNVRLIGERVASAAKADDPT